MTLSVHHFISKEVEITSSDTIGFLDTRVCIKAHIDKVV